MTIVLIVAALAAIAVAGFVVISVRSRNVPAPAVVRTNGGAASTNGRTGTVQRIVDGTPAAGAPVPVAAEVEPEPEPEIVPAAQAQPATAPVATEPPPAEIRWCSTFDPRSGELDERARLRLIGDLGVVAKDWCVPLLAQAYAEEPHPGHRQAALIALAACRNSAAAPTFRRAIEAGDANEQAIAADALADLEPPPPQPRRRTVERY